MRFEKLRPFVWPLLIDVVLPALERNRCGEQYKRGQASQSLDESWAAVWREVLGDFQRYRQIEDTPESKGFRQVKRLEAFLRNLQKTSVHVLAVNPKYLLHAEFPKNGQPASVATADIYYAVCRKEPQHEGNNDFR